MHVFDIPAYIATRKPKNEKFFTIAIDGRGGSGKSSLVEYLRQVLPGFVVLNGDDYFEPVENQIVWGDFNDERFAADVIEPLETSNTFAYKPYDWHAEPHITEKIIEITKGFCLERCYSFRFDLDWDLKIWVETPKDVCLERGLTREHMPKDRVLAAWKVWQKQEDDYIRDFHPQQKSDVVLDGTKLFEGQL